MLGRVFVFKHFFLPTLACKSLVFYNKKTTEKQTKKKWKDVSENLFAPVDISFEELEIMREARCQPVFQNNSDIELSNLLSALNELQD